MIVPIIGSGAVNRYSGALPTDYSNMEFWLKVGQRTTVSNGRVTCLGDLSGNGRDHAASEDNASLYIANSINGQPGIEHGGRFLTATIDDLSSVLAYTRFTMLSKLTFPGPEDSSIAIATQAASGEVNQDPFVGWNVDPMLFGFASAINWNNGENRFCGANWDGSGPILLIGSYNGAGTKNTDIMRIYFNGERMVPYYHNPNTGNIDLTYSLLGGKNTTWQNCEIPADMHLLEDIFYSRFFSDTEIMELVEYFFWQFAMNRPQYRLLYELMDANVSSTPQLLHVINNKTPPNNHTLFSCDSSLTTWFNPPTVNGDAQIFFSFGQLVELLAYDIVNSYDHPENSPNTWSFGTATSGRICGATTEYPGFGAYHAFNRPSGPSKSSGTDGWSSQADPATTPQYLAISDGVVKTARYYNIQNCWATGYNWADWILQGYSDGTWIDIDTVTGDTTDTPFAWKFGGNGKAINANCSAFRLKITKTIANDGRNCACCQVILLDEDGAAIYNAFTSANCELDDLVIQHAVTDDAGDGSSVQRSGNVHGYVLENAPISCRFVKLNITAQNEYVDWHNWGMTMAGLLMWGAAE